MKNLLCIWLLLNAVSLTQGQQPTRPAGANRVPPNIILIVADDLGYHDLGCQGATDLKTPNIDRLAAGGVRCTAGYTAAPVCSPSRCGLLTGRQPNRYGFENNLPPNVEPQVPTFGLPLSEKTIANYLKNSGYATGLIGKWHLGTEKGFYPTERGFDEYFGFLGGQRTFLPNAARPNEKGTFAMKDPWADLRENRTSSDRKADNLTDALAQRATEFITTHQKEPFLLVVTFNAPHAPMEATPKYLSRFPDIQDTKRKTMAAMMAAMDDGVGQIMQTLKNQQIYQNTLIVFVSDNGGITPQNASQNTPFSGVKSELLEGGIRVPFIVWYGDKLPKGKTYDKPVSTLDLLPTALTLAGQQLPANLDGVNLMPFLTGTNRKSPHEFLSWRFGPLMAIRNDRYKLLKLADQTTEFYDLTTNPAEDLTKQATNPAERQKLEQQLTAWNRQLSQPMWGFFPMQGLYQPIQNHLKRHGKPDTPKAAQAIYESFFKSDLSYLPSFAPKPTTLIYKQIDSTKLKMEVFYPADFAKGQKRPAILFFFGGGWNAGKLDQFWAQAQYFASRGLITVLADYRVQSRHKTTPFVAVADARSAMRYFKANADRLGIDSSRVVAGGGSAGGHLAAATALLSDYDDPTDPPGISPRPMALLLYNPVIDNGPGGYGHERIGEAYPKFSPFHNIRAGAPPTLFIQGTNDKWTPVATAEAYKKRMEAVGSRCELHLYDNQGHGFFNGAPFLAQTIEQTDRFLQSLQLLSGPPTINTFTLTTR